MTEKLWRGSFGDAYTQRNALVGDKRERFWTGLLGQLVLDGHPVTKALEFGCNVGANLQHLVELVPVRVGGCDVNAEAIAIARHRLRLHDQVELVHNSMVEAGYADASFDLVFTSGVLIHLDDEQLALAMGEVVRVSSRYVLAIEYWSPHREEVFYRGQSRALWKRPYGDIYEQRFPQLVRTAEGFLGPDDGWDDCNWWLWEKR